MTMFKVIDICGPTPKGTGLQNMREAIIESKWKYDVSTEDKQVCSWIKVGILIELSMSSKRLVGRAWSWTSWSGTFTWSALLPTRWSTGRPTTRRASSPGWTTTTSSGNRKHWRSWFFFDKEIFLLKIPQLQNNQLQIRSMIDSGKDKLEWYRTVDAAKLDHLKEMMLQVTFSTYLHVGESENVVHVDDVHERCLTTLRSWSCRLSGLIHTIEPASHHAPLLSGQLQREPGHPYPHHLWLCLCHVMLTYHISFHILWIWFGPR